MVMMIKLVILILVALHANNLTITHSHPSKLDIVQITFINCLVLKFEYCHEFYREHLFSLIDWAYRKLEDCKYEHELSFEHPLVNVAIGCIKSCINKSRFKPFRLEACFIHNLLWRTYETSWNARRANQKSWRVCQTTLRFLLYAKSRASSEFRFGKLIINSLSLQECAYERKMKKNYSEQPWPFHRSKSLNLVHNKYISIFLYIEK